MSKRKKTLAIDFDGTICKYQKFGPITNEPNEGAKEIITQLKEAGWIIIVHTCRAKKEFEDYQKSIDDIRDWMDHHSIPFDEITASTPIATAYIDARGIRFTNWQDIKNYFL